MAEFYLDENGNLATKKKKKKGGTEYTLDDEGNLVELDKEERKWFQKGAFEDGYQFGDVTKTILGIEDKKKLNTFTAPETDYSLEELKQKRDYLAGRTWNTAEQSADLLKYTKMYNQMALYQYSETLSKTKMDGQNHTVLEEIEILANMKNGKEKDKRKDAVLKKMEELGMDTSFYVDFAGDGEFSWSAFGKWAKNAAMAGLASVNKGLLDTADVILGAPMKALGWEDNPFSKGAEYFGTVYDTYKYNANIYANELGGGAWNFGSEAIEGTTGALPHALLMFMTGGASTTATTSSITTQSAMQTGNWLTKAGLTVESMMKNPQYWMSFSRTLGSDYKEAKELGVSDAAATVGAILKSTVNAGIEIGFDGGSGIQGLDDALKNGGIPFYEWVESTLEEGGEEMLQKFVGEAIDKVGYGSDKEILNPIEYAKEGALGVISGAALGGGQTVVQSGVNAYNEHQQNKLTDVEQAVVDKVYKDLISEAEKEGKITEREKSKIYDAVLERMDKGYIDTETIEGVLGDRSAYDSLVKESEEFDKLYNTPGGQLSKAQQDRLAQLEEKNKKSPYKALLEAENGKLSQGVQDMVKDSRLAESYAERGRRGEKFQADVSRYDAKQRATVLAAIDSGVLNNTNRSHELVDFVAKLAADKGLTFDFANNEKLKETGFALEGVTVNGFVNASGVTVNVQSAKALNSVVGHEITHVLEGTELYGALQEAVTEYARAKGEYQSRYDSFAKLYALVEGANVEAELVADLVGDYLFTDKAFVQKLSTEHRNVFQKIFDEVKYLCKVVTAGSKEAKKLLEVKKIFEEAYRQDAKNPTGEGGVRYSLSSIVGASGKNYGVGVYLDSTLLSNLTEDERIDMVKEYVKELGGSIFTAYDNNGNAVDIHIVESSKKFKNKSGNRVPVNKDLTYRLKNEVKQEAIALVDELVQASTYHGKEPATHPHDWVDDNGANDWDLWKTYIQDKQNTVWEASLRIANSANGEKILYDIYPIKMVEGAGTAATTTTTNNIAQTKPTVNTKNSLSENGQDDIAPLPWQVRGQDVALEDIAPIGENVVTKQNAASEGELVSEGKVLAENAGIRSQLRNNQEKLDAMQLVAEIQVPAGYAQLDIAGKKNWVAEKLRPTGYKVERKGFGVIDFAKKRLKSAFNYFDKNSVEEVAFEAIPYVLENGIEVANRSDHKDRNYGTVTIAAPITINGKRGNMAVVVKRTSGNYYKVHRILTPDGSVFHLPEMTNEAESTPAGESPKIGSLATPKDSASTVSIPEQEAVVNPDDSTGAAPSGKERKWVGTSTGSEAVDGKILPSDLDQELTHYQPIPNKKTLGIANARLDNLGYDEAVSYFNSKVTADDVRLEDIALGERLIQEAVKKGDYETASELIMDISILGTELGQKVQALSIIKRLTPEGQLKMLQKIVERGKAKGDKAYEGVEITEDMAKTILETSNGDGTYDQNALNAVVEQVKQQLADQMQVAFMEKVNAWRYLSMLGNPKTHIRNMVSNVAMMGARAVKNAIARTIEDIAPVQTRTKTWKSASDEVRAFAKQATTEAYKGEGDSKYSESGSIKAKRQIFQNKALNAVAELNSKALSLEDTVFSKHTYRTTLQEYLTANGITTQADIESNPKLVAEAKAYAMEQAKEATFQQDSYIASKISQIEQKNALFGAMIGSTIPFKKTPVNVAKTAVAYSPLGFARNVYDAVQVKKGNMDASEAIDHLAQTLTGTSLSLIGYALASMGIFHGAGEDDKEGKFDYQLGEQSYSVTIGDSTYSLSWLSPVAMPLFVGVNAYEQLVDGKEWNADMVFEALGKTLDPMSEMSFLSSLDDVLSSYESGAQKFLGIFESMGQNYISQMIPTLSSQIAATFDDTKRTTKASADSDFTFGEETVRSLMYKIPGLRNVLEPSTDIWGNEVKQADNVLTRALESFLAPYSRREDISTDVDTEIRELYSQVGDSSLIPSVPYSYINYSGEKYEMSAEEFTSYKQTYGQTAYDLMEKLFATNTYRNADDETKADMIGRVYDHARDVAKQELLQGRGVTYTNTTQDGKKVYNTDPIVGAIENDMSVDEYKYSVEYPKKYQIARAVGGYDSYMSYLDALGDIKSDKDKAGNTISGSRKQKVVDYINGLDAAYGEKIILYVSAYSSKESRAAYGAEIVDYLSGREDISYEDMVSILTELGFTVRDGWVTWD